MKTITIYSTPNCVHCHHAKDFLTDHNTAFTDVDVSTDIDLKRKVVEMTGQMGVPVIVIEEEGQEPDIMVGFSQSLLASKLGIAA